MSLDIRPIIEQYDASCQPTASEYLAGAGGFSGSQFWRLTTPRGTLALRLYAPGLISEQQLHMNAALLRGAAQSRLGFAVPVPIETPRGRPFVLRQHEFWDLCDWLPGQAVAEGSSTLAHVRNAMTALAKLQLAFNPHSGSASRSWSASRAVEKRLWRIDELRLGRLPQIVAYVTSHPKTTPFWCESAHTLAMWFNLESDRLAKALESCSGSVPVAISMLDVWRDNVLFDPQANVLSVIDFADFDTDSFALDIARLLGSLIAGNPQWWHEGLAAYESVRPISNAERDLAILLDRANVLLSAWNWLEWLFVERRKFSDLHRVEERVRHFLTRLPEVFTPDTPRW